MPIKPILNYIIFTALFLAVFQINVNTAAAQEMEEDSRRNTLFLKFSGGVMLPAGDLSNRFSINGIAGGGVYYKTRTNWIFGGEFDYIFGGDVKEDDILDNIKTSGGYLIGVDGLLYNPVLYERGYRMQLGGGKIFPLSPKNRDSGFLLQGNVGFLQHKISYYVPEKSNLPQLSDEMKKGYDRLTNGISFSEYIGYFYLSQNRLVNFTIGVEFMQAITQNRRSLNYDTMTKDDSQRMDMMMGVKASWILPLYKNDTSTEFFYN